MTAMIKKLADSKLFSESIKTVRSFTDPTDHKSYAQWREWALDEDGRSGMARWREKTKTPLYDYGAIQRRCQRLKDLRNENNDRGLLFALHEGVHGNMGGMGNPDMYNQALVGTKKLVEEYIEEIVVSLDHIDQASGDVISREEKQAFFNRVDECFGRTALMLSGGGSLGPFHLGVVKALAEQNILPNIISGSSAGSVFTGVVGTHTNEELVALVESGALFKNLPDDLTEGAGFFTRLLKPRGAALDEEQLAEVIASAIPDLTFEEAFAKTGRHINISVAPASLHQTSRLLNSVTSPNVYIRTAVMASCAVPGVFEPVQLRAKNFSGGSQDYLPGRLWIDGSVHDDLPAKRLSRLYGVNHFIASMINPVVLPFVSDPDIPSAFTTLFRPYKAFATEWLKTSSALGRRINVPMSKAIRMRASMARQVLTQKYTADINIRLKLRHVSPLRLLSHPTAKEIEALMLAGERATWPLISRIDNATQISRAVARILEKYQPKI